MSDFEDSKDTTQEPSTETPEDKAPSRRLKGLDERKTSKIDADALKTTSNTLKTWQPAPIEYDVDLLDDFLETVFHTELEHDEEILTWRVSIGRSPGFPKAEEDLQALRRSRKPQALYYATSTCHTDEEGKLYNRKGLFRGFYVLVLDDIGTKVPVEDIPELLKPTYIIESSEGNYQYGYVLKEPVRDLEAAELLVQLCYEAGLSDNGGKMATKLVRLPEGVNGKAGDKKEFRVRLIHMDGPLWEPQAILDAIEAKVSWSDILEDAMRVAKSRTNMSSGTSLWSPVKPQAASLDGIIDPVLEWLYESEYIIQDTGDWVHIQCPWAHNHTDPNQTSAGYNPLGRGDAPERRGFHCFHDSCAANKTLEFLQFIAASSGIEAGVIDRAAGMTSTWVYDAHADGVWKVKGVAHPIFLTMQAFSTMNPHKSKITTVDNKQIFVKDVELWKQAPSRVSVYGQTFAPHATDRIVLEAGHHYINMYTPPDWGDGDIEQRHVDMFHNFLKYLIPKPADLEYFLDWLAAKVKDMAFRGAAILMIAPQQGTGRTTLTDMLAVMFGQQNQCNMPFNKLICADEKFNDWQQYPIITSDETLNTGNSNFYRAYERLKEIIDPRPKKTVINSKYRQPRLTTVYSSYIFLSNHANAIALGESDRRFYVLNNATKPQPHTYYDKLNAWLREETDKGEPAWARNVWRWLKNRTINMDKLLAPPIMTDAKKLMRDESRSNLEVAVDGLIAHWPYPYFVLKTLRSLVGDVESRLSLESIPNWERVFDRIMRGKSLSVHKDHVARINGSPARFRYFPQHHDCRDAPSLLDGGRLRPEDVQTIRGVLEFIDMTDIRNRFYDYLTIHDL